MALFQEKSEKKSLIITVIINTALILVLFFFGLTYMDPPEEGGIAINFGDSNVGSGNVQPTTPVESSPVEEKSVEETTPEEEAEPAEDIEEEVVTQDTEDAPVIDDSEEKKEEKTEAEEEQKEEEPEEEIEPEPDPEPEESTSEALKNILSGKEQDGETSEGEGDDNQAGDKGDPSGDPNASSYYGKGKGLDGDGNYRLGGREALNKEKFTQECNESGTVVVEIKVNRQGEVIQAKPGIKGTTNTSSCLLNPAKRAALATKFNPDSKAPSVQTGEIIYEFKLSE